MPVNNLKTFFNKLYSSEGTKNSPSGWKLYLFYAFISLLILIFTFPKYFPSIQLGVDGSEYYALNYLFSHHIQFGSQVVFTYGPLGFLCNPICMGNNLFTAIIFSNILRFIFIYCFLILGYVVNRTYRVLHIILAIGFCNMMYIDMAFIGGTILAVLLCHARKEVLWLIAGCLLAALALLVKSSYGLISISVLYSYSIYALFATKRPWVLLYITFLTAFFFVFTWFLLYHNVYGMGIYFRAMYEFSRDNSNAYQLEVMNHWGILSLALIFFYVPAFFTKNELTRVLYLVTIAALYAAFRYSFAREEDWHQIFLFTFVIMIGALFLLLNSNAKAIAVMMPLAAISLLYANMVMTNSYTIDDRKRMTGIGNFITFVTDYKNAVQLTKQEDSATLQSKMLTGEQRALIENKTVDCYPMELAYVAANTLNWAPRPNLQILAYTPWLDNHNAAFLNSHDAPKFYIWELEQSGYPTDNYNYSLDNHFLFNDEPQTVYNFFNHYDWVNHDKKTAIFSHSDTALLGDEHVIASGRGCLNDWMPVPVAEKDNVIRARIKFTNTLKGTLRKLFYKDVVYYIQYKLEYGPTVRTYRFIPGNAVSGLWVNPYSTDITNMPEGENVQYIRIIVSKPGYVEHVFKIAWTEFHFK
jgi:hypothetical protein